MPLIDRAYAAAATAATPALRAMLRRRVERGKEVLARLPERWGEDATPRPNGTLLWLHAASVGEVVSVLPVLPLLAVDHVLLTTGTVTSAEVLAQRLPALECAERVTHRFVPLDVPGWVARFLDHWRPDAAGFVEGEVWPNTLAACRARGIPLTLVNARLSPRSAAGWGRVPGFAARNFGAFGRVLAQSPADAARVVALGGRHVTAPGNLKFAAPPLPVADGALAELRASVGHRPLWVAASTHPGEEALAAAAHHALAPRHPGLLTIVVPRHPERGAAVAAELQAPRRSQGATPPAGGLWVADTIGELGLFYRLSGVAFVGGSLVAHGGQNPLEAARLGCVVAVGPHTENFSGAVEVLERAGSLARVADAAELAAWVGGLLDDPGRRAAMANAGVAAATAHGGLPQLTADALLATLP